jgi:hypothetical protein
MPDPDGTGRLLFHATSKIIGRRLGIKERHGMELRAALPACNCE